MAKWTSFEPCVVTGQNPCELHHLYTRGAHPELAHHTWNTISLSRKIHREWHDKGAKYMTEKYPAIKKWMVSRGWYVDDFSKKWCHAH